MSDYQEIQLKRKWQFLGNFNIYIWCWVLLREFELELNQKQSQGLKVSATEAKGSGKCCVQNRAVRVDATCSRTA